MVRILKKDGRLAFASWPPELVVGKLSAIVSKYDPLPVTSPLSSPMDWGVHDKVQNLLPGVKEISFERGTINIPILSPNHYWQDTITKVGFMIQVIEALKNQNDKEKIESFRKDYVKTLKQYICDNVLRFGYLITIARK